MKNEIQSISGVAYTKTHTHTQYVAIQRIDHNGSLNWGSIRKEVAAKVTTSTAAAVAVDVVVVVVVTLFV